MKKSVFYLSLFLLSLTACGPAVWSPFPEADFVSYLPYNTGDKITFESDGETMVWEVTDTKYEYEENNNPCAKCYKEYVQHTIYLQNNTLGQGIVYSNSFERSNISFYISFNESELNEYAFSAEYSSEVEKRKDFKTLLVNTLQLAGTNADNKAIIEKNKGVTQFETNGKVWKLVELK